MQIKLKSLKFFLLFSKNIYGSIVFPYETYRKLAKGGNLPQSVFVFLLIFSYFSFSTLARNGLRTNPYVLTLSFSKVSFGFILSSIIVLFLLVFLGRLFGGKGSLKNIFLPWSYSLLPTFLWFLITLVFYIFFPPPRTTSLLGQIFSLIFIAFSLFLFYWKFILYYLTLRFGMKMDLLRIIGVSIIFFPLLFLYSIVIYKLKVFRVPFI
ncbi:MAG: hypothetical protein UU76_C0032G0010 [Parcubacteria group bacterium GW2011_GWC1_41_7]|nr:MAG: hypothetical protein UU76_C0032G0010 [Parcubacteria group bacterium GW2011_GWC1_41_7]